MKRLFTLLLISFAALSCEMTDENIDDLLDKRDWVVFAEGTELSVDVPSEQTVLNYKFESTLDWEVKTEADWLEVDPMRGKAGKDIKIQIKVAKNKDKEGRTGYADLTLSNNDSYRITINQAGEGDENDENDIDIPNNQIWYTSVDGKIVEPYSGEYNYYADAPTTFGVNIVYNTYVDGKGVIEFDGDVTTIGWYAFFDCSSLTSITIPDSVTTIEIYAFQGCSSLESITIPDSVTTIEHGAFDLCKSLNAVHITNLASWCNIDFINLFTDGSVDLSANPLYYAHNIYLNGELVTDLVIPDGVNEIKFMVFALCNSIKSVTIPNSVTTIGDYAFSSCSGLTSATIPNSVTTIGDYAFSSCSGLTSATIPNSVTTLGDAVFRKCNSLTSVTIPDSITTIGKSAFYECVSIKNIVIPNSVTSIGDFAFGSCSSLTSVTIPNSVTTLGDAVFRKCSSLTSVNIPNGVTTIRKSTFYECTSLANIVIPDSVTEIGEFAFAWCSNLTSVNIPFSVVSIGDAAFKSCNNLRLFSGKFASDDGKSLIIDNTLNAFAIGCGAIEYAIPNGVNMIGNSVFCNCESLTSVTIPDSITTIGELAFYGCSSLTSVYCKPTTPPSIVCELVFNNNGPDRIIYVPMGAVEAYKSASGWSSYASAIEGYNF